MALSVREMEMMAIQLRKDLGLALQDRLDPLRISIDGVTVLTLDDVDGINQKTKTYLQGEGSRQWSAMSVPLDREQEKWAIVRNDLHDEERQRASIMEEYWHILLGHELTKIVKFGAFYGRSFESDEEHDAYYLAAASLAPGPNVKRFIEAGGKVEEFAKSLGVSKELVEYRIKRLGLWRQYKPKTVSYGSRS